MTTSPIHIRPKSRTIQGLQILRGVAALAVLCHHILEESRALPLISELPNSLILVGACGVDIFFVISGFIMLYTNKERVGQAGEGLSFIFNRLLRIAPLYWLTTFSFVAAKIAGLYQHKAITLSSLIAPLLFVETGHNIVGVGWTLNYEMYFYLIFACCLVHTKSIRGLMYCASAAIVVGVVVGKIAGQPFLGNRIAIEFSFGIGLAFVFTKVKTTRGLSLSMLAVGTAGMIFFSTISPHTATAGLDESWRFFAWGLPAACLVFCSLHYSSVVSLPARIFLFLGDTSYSLYLTHSLVMTAFARLLKMGVFQNLNPLFLVILALAASLILGMLTYLLVERPIERFAKARLHVGYHRSEVSQPPTLARSKAIGEGTV